MENPIAQDTFVNEVEDSVSGKSIQALVYEFNTPEEIFNKLLSKDYHVQQWNSLDNIPTTLSRYEVALITENNGRFQYHWLNNTEQARIYVQSSNLKYTCSYVFIKASYSI